MTAAEIRGRDIGSVFAEAQAKIDQQVKLEPGSFLTWGGQFENFSVLRQPLTIVVAACFLLIDLLLIGALTDGKVPPKSLVPLIKDLRNLQLEGIWY